MVNHLLKTNLPKNYESISANALLAEKHMKFHDSEQLMPISIKYHSVCTDAWLSLDACSNDDQHILLLTDICSCHHEL